MSQVKLKPCCENWLNAIENLQVSPKVWSFPEKTMADALQKLLIYYLGNYCPCCGKKLVKRRVSV